MFRNDAVLLRKRQVETLAQFFRASVRELASDSAYEITVAAPDRVVVLVTITLPDSFPYVAPILQCVPPVPSPHLDRNGYVLPTAHEQLARWSVQNVLGKLVYDVIANVIAPATPFAASSTQNRPGVVMGGSPGLGAGNGGNTSGAVGNNNSGLEGRKIPRNSGKFDSVPEIPTTFKELESKSLSELQRLADNESELLLFLEEVQLYRSLGQLRDSARAGAVAKAQQNLRVQPAVDQVSEALKIANAELLQLQHAYNQIVAKNAQTSGAKSRTPEALIASLAEAAEDLERETDAMAAAMLKGEIPWKQFVGPYLERRTLYHMRKAKLETVSKASEF